MPKVQFQLTTQGEKQLLTALQRAEGKIEKLQGKMKDIGKSGKGSFGSVGAELQKVTSQLVGPLGVAAAVGAVVTQLKAAYDLMVKNQNIAKDVQLNIAQSRAGALMNLPSDFKGGSAALDTMVERVAKQSGLGRAQVYQAMSPGLSARGSVGMKGFESSMTLASTIEAATGGQTSAGDLAGSLLDLNKATGMDDAMANLGWLRQAGAASRMTSLEGQLNMIPGISAARSRGISAEKAMETQAAISQMIVDPSGEKTRTGFVNLTKDLYTKDLLPSTGFDPKTGKKKTSFSPLSGSFDERISQLQGAYAAGDDETRRAMEKQIGGRAGMSPFITNMLKNTDLFQTTMSAAQRQVAAPDASAAKQAKEYLSNTFGGDYGNLLKTNIKATQGTEDIYAGRSNAALNAQAKELMRERLGAMGQLRWHGAADFGLDALSVFKGQNYAETAAGDVALKKSYGQISGPEADRLIDELIKISQRIQANTDAMSNAPTPNTQDND